MSPPVISGSGSIARYKALRSHSWPRKAALYPDDGPFQTGATGVAPPITRAIRDYPGEGFLPLQSEIETMRRDRVHPHRRITNQGETRCRKRWA